MQLKNRIPVYMILSLIGCLLLSSCDSSQASDAVKPSVQPSAQPTVQASAPQAPSPTATATTLPEQTITPLPSVQSLVPTVQSPVPIVQSPLPTASANVTASVTPTELSPSSSQHVTSKPLATAKPAKPIAKPSPVITEVSRIMGMDGVEGWGIGDGRLLYTGNVGKTWEVRIPDGIGAKDRLIGGDFQNYFLGFAYYLRSEKQAKLLATHRIQDGGGESIGWETVALPTVEEWETSSDVTTHSSIDDYEANYVLLTSSPGLGQMNKSLYRTDDSGKSWARIGDISSIISGYPTGVTFRVPNEGWITATYHGQVDFPLFRTKDGGKTWEVQQVEIPDEFKNGYANTLPPVFDEENGHHGLFIAEFVQDDQKTYILYETYDDGETWLPLNYRLRDVQEPPVYYFDNLIMGRAISMDGKTIYTMDTYIKEDWQKVEPNMELKDASQFLLRMDGYGWVFLNGQMKVTADGGKTWSNPK